MQELVGNLGTMSFSDVIKASARIHHSITVIHPFADGNGRCSRAMLNWIFRLKGLPPVYIKFPEKEEYYEALKMADSGQGYNKLYKVIMRESIRSSIKLNQI